jgi:lipopolysaccharide export system permease protein
VKIIDRYILKELLGPFILSVAILLFLLLTQQMLRLTELLIDKGIEPTAVVKLFIYLLPSFLVLTLPIAVLIASLSAFNRLSADYEIVAFKSAGVGMVRLLMPVAAFSALVCGLVYYLSIVAMPWSGTSLKDLALKLLKKQVSVGIEEGAFNDLFQDMVIYVDEMPTFMDLKGIFIYDLRIPDEPRLILAKQGSVVNDPETGTLVLNLMEGSLHQKGQDPKQYQRIIFSSYHIKFDLNTLLSQQSGISGGQLTLAEIKEQLQATQGQDPKWLRRLQAYYRNYSLPLACLIFGVLGMPLGIHTRRAGRLGGFAMGVVVVGLYYLLMISGDFLVTARFFPPLLAAWFPNLVVGMGALFLIILMSKEGHWRPQRWAS